MKNLILFLVLIFGGSVLADAQGPGRNPKPTPSMPEMPSQQKRERVQDNITGRSNDLKMVENFPVGNDEGRIVQQYIVPLYREPSKEERRLLAPSDEDAQKFGEFLRRKNSGLIKLIADKGCDKNPEVVVSSPHCATYAMPGAGASFSFRINDYRNQNLGDLTFTGKSFRSLGALIHGILVNVGDVPLEKVDLQNAAVNYLVKFEPAQDLQKAQEIAEQLRKGIENDDFTYRSHLPAAENTTYVLRAIAYDGVSPRAVKGITYNELEFDKRKDIIVAFRVVRRESEENVTILWKELASKKPPKLAAQKKN